MLKLRAHPASMGSCVLVLLAVGLGLCAGGSKFDAFTSCDACTGAGFGWSKIKHKCGAYKNTRCDQTESKSAGRVDPGTPEQAPGSCSLDVADAQARIREADHPSADGNITTWIPSDVEVSRFSARITPFAWTPVWAAPLGGEEQGLTMRRVKKQIAGDRTSNPGEFSPSSFAAHTSLCSRFSLSPKPEPRFLGALHVLSGRAEKVE
jgi:hypothetical protein